MRRMYSAENDILLHRRAILSGFQSKKPSIILGSTVSSSLFLLVAPEFFCKPTKVECYSYIATCTEQSEVFRYSFLQTDVIKIKNICFKECRFSGCKLSSTFTVNSASWKTKCDSKQLLHCLTQ